MEISLHCEAQETLHFIGKQVKRVRQLGELHNQDSMAFIIIYMVCATLFSPSPLIM